MRLPRRKSGATCKAARPLDCGSPRPKTCRVKNPVPAPRASPLENRALTGLRGLAALDVMLGHYNAPGFAVLRFVEFHGPAVDLFFCLSAFTLCLAYQAGDGLRLSWRDFAVARFARIYPIYFLALVASFHLARDASGGFAYYPPGFLVRDGFEQLLLVSNWPLIGRGVAWNPPAWSVSVEAFCYVCLFYPLYAAARAVERVPLPLRVGAVVALAAVGYVSAAMLYHPETGHWGVDRATGLWPYLAPSLRGATMFTAGWLVYVSYRARDRLCTAVASGTDAISVAILLFAVGVQFHAFDRWQCLVLVPFLVLGLAANARSVTARVLAWRPLHYLGRISYSLYLLHVLVWSELYDHGGAFFRQNDNRVWVECLISIALASTNYHLIEAPARRFLRRRLARRSGSYAATLSFHK